MKQELIDGVPAANDREQIGKFLRYAFPLKLGSFAELLSDLGGKERMRIPSRH